MNELKSELGQELEDGILGEDWDARLSPVDELVSLLYPEKHTPCPSPVNEDEDEDELELAELETLGKRIDEVRKHQEWLKKPEVKKKINNDPRLILYRLPLTDTQREAIYNDLMKQDNDLFASGNNESD
jgi:hypothetical protein